MLCFRSAATERFSKFIYRQLTGEKLPAGNLIESDSTCVLVWLLFFFSNAGQQIVAAAFFFPLLVFPRCSPSVYN